MTVLKSHISWTDSTWSPTVGCTAVSAGCDACYAKAIVHRLMGGAFETVRLLEGRLDDVKRFTPLRLPDGSVKPRLVFVNSLSDIFHEQIPDGFRDKVFDRMEGRSDAVFQLLTKRGMTMRRYIEQRYGSRGIPANIWLGVSVEDNRVAGRIDQLRRLKDACGAFTAFLSVEPLIGPVDSHNYSGIDQVLIGGESGPRARPMDIAWARSARDQARKVGAAVWFKQFGTWQSNPLYQASNAELHRDRVRHAIAAGEREAAIVDGKITGEKGGATLDGEVLHELPPAYQVLTAALNRTRLI